MKIVIIGGTGPIGSQVGATLKQQGHEVLSASPRITLGQWSRPLAAV